MSEKQFKALLVGAGGMGRAWAKNLRDCPQVQTVGWVDVKRGLAAEAIHTLQLEGVEPFNNFARALKQTQADFVVDVTVPEAHATITIQSLRAGLPVLGEKPMADSMAQARRMVAASEKSRKLYMVSQSRRYDNRLAAYARLIRENLGPVGILNSDFYIGAHFGGFRDQMKSPLMLDMAIHTVDAARYLCRGDPLWVYCEEFNPSWSWYKGDAAATAIYEMTGGLRYTYRGSWCADGRQGSWECDWRAVGAHGSATWNGSGEILADVVNPADEQKSLIYKTHARAAKIPENPHNGIAGSLRDFLHALETGQTPMGECHDNIKSLAMVFAALESSKKKKRVKVVC